MATALGSLPLPGEKERGVGKRVKVFCRILIATAVMLFSGHAGAQGTSEPEQAYRPQVGQPGKDVVWVPTPERLIVRMLQMADTTSADFVMDLGSGDGRIPIAAAKRFGARALGIEYDPGLVQLSILAAEREGVADRVRFLRQDLFQTDFSAATVITLYLGIDTTPRLRPRLLELKPGTRVVSHQFTLGDWEPDETARVENSPAYLWVVPARAAGTWALKLGADAYELSMQQQFQMIRGTARRAGKSSPVVGGRLRGVEIRFTFIDANGDARHLTGRVAGDTMAGVAQDQPDLKWSAQRR